MTALIPVTALPVDSTMPASVGGNKLNINHGDTANREGFGKFLGDALGDNPGGIDGSAANASQLNDLATQLQSLPHGGKLLPLLEQLLEGAVANGSDPGEVMAQFTETLDQLSAHPDMDPQQALAALVYQLLETQPRHPGPGVGQAHSLRRWVDTALQQSAGAAAGRLPMAANAAAAAEVTPHSFDKLVSQIPLQAATAGQTAPEFVAALQSIRRLAGNQGAGQESLVRSDTVPAGAAAPANPATATAAPPGLVLGVPVQQAGWDQALSERIQWLVSQGAQGANIKLNPAHLGPMEVRIQMHNDQANIQFTATHAVVREALEAALPRLREMFGSSGVELVNVDVSGESFAEQQRTGTEADRHAYGQVGHGAGDSDSDGEETVMETPLIAAAATGRLDIFV